MEAINWDAVSAIAEILGAIVVVASLVFVGLQIMQNTRATKAASVESITSDLRAFNYKIGENREFAEILYKGWFSPDELRGPDLFRHNNIMIGMLQLFLNIFYQTEKGAFENDLFSSYLNYFRVIAALPGVRVHWAERSEWYPKDFRDFMEHEILAKADDRIYKSYLERDTSDGD